MANPDNVTIISTMDNEMDSAVKVEKMDSAVEVVKEDGDTKEALERIDGADTTSAGVFKSQQQLFTSEIFKIELQGLPRFFGVGQAKKIFNSKLKLNCHKIKVTTNQLFKRAAKKTLILVAVT